MAWVSAQHLDAHAPVDWRVRYATTDPLDALVAIGASPFLLISVDIRQSTAMRRLARNKLLHEAVVANFVDTASKALRDHGFWWDKFEGDGFIAYVPVTVDGRNGTVQIREALSILAELLEIFGSRTMQVIESNCVSVPPGAGLALGLDGGKFSFWNMNGDLTIQGDPVIGAVRMQSVASAGEMVASASVGAEVEGGGTAILPPALSLSTDKRQPKTYSEPVDVYVLTLA